MKKILIINHFAEDVGGCETVFGSLANIFDTRVVGLNQVFGAGIKGIGSNYYRNAHIDRSAYFVKYLNNYIKNFDLDLIITNDDIATHFWRLPVPYVPIFQNPYMDIARKMLKEKHYDQNQADEYYFNYGLAQFLAGKNSAGNVAVSDYMAKYAEDLGIKSHKIEHGVDVNFWKPTTDKKELRKKWNIGVDKRVGIVVTKFHPLKYHLVPPVIKEYPDIHWIIVFGNEQTSNYVPINKNVSLFYKMDREQMKELYQLSDFYFCPSYVESFNLSAIEAASCNLPIIVTKTGYFSYDKDIKDMGISCSANTKDFILATGVLNSDLDSFEPRKGIIKRNLTFDRFSSDWKSYISSINKKV